MKRNKWWTYGIFIALTLLVGMLSGFLSREGMEQVSKLPQSALTPPSWVFPVVWGILYTLMGFGAARIWLSPESEERSRGLWLYLFQLVFNFFWTILFFRFSLYGLAFLWLLALIGLIVIMICLFSKIVPTAAYLQLPYLLWCLFAAYLNFAVYMLNKN